MAEADTIQRLNAALEGRYRIERELGAGGMATVYLAEDLRHHRRVALKVLKPELAAVVGAERFLAEIEVTANLQHPHILPLHDSGEADGLLFYVMPYVEGESLRDRLDQEHQLPVEEAVSITIKLAEALDYAHRQGVIHRDMKPANVLLHEGEPVIADFGIALAVGAAGGGRLTETGLSVGTPHYMSPEQATGDQNVGPPTDVYALGCVLYEMLVGEPPFMGGSAQAVLGRIITSDAPSATAQRKAVPLNVDAVIRRALEKVPADRFSGAHGLAHALKVPGFRHGDGPPESAGWAPASVFGLGALTGVVVAALVGTFLFSPRGSGIELGNIRKLTFDPGLELLPVISPDGQDVAFVATESGPVPGRVVVRSLAGGRTDVVSDEEVGGEEYPRWSPDGSTLLFQAAGRIFEVPARGGTARPIAPEVGGGTASYGVPSPDGDRFAYIKSSGDRSEIVVSSEAGDIEVTEVDPTSHSLVWSPDGSWLAYVEGNRPWVTLGSVSPFGNVSPSALKVVSAQGGTPVEIAEAQSLNVSPTFLPDGRLLFVSGRGGARDVYLAELGPDGTVRGPPVRVTLGLEPHSISVSGDGRRLVYGTLARRQNVYEIVIPVSGTASAYEALAVTTGQQVIEGIAVSPDGEWLAIDSDRAGTQDVYRRRLDGPGSVQLTSLPSDEFVRSWSRDGALVAGHGFNEGVRDLFVVDSDGLSFRFVDPSPAHDRYPDFSPDGSRIAFQSQRGEGGIYLLAQGSGGDWGQASRIGPGEVPRWSPDGSAVASVTLDRVWVMPSAGGEPRAVGGSRSGGYIDGVEWNGTDTLLVLHRLEDRTSVVASVALSTGAEREVIVFDDPARQPRPEMAVHEGRLYFTLGEFEADLWVVDLEVR